jgi:branched-chain amino acid transport system substrate-binding protein
MSGISRRKVLGGGAIALAAPSIVLADEAPVKIGAILPRQGPFALHGEAATEGIKIAIDQVGNKVQGRPVQMVIYDDPSPSDAQQNMRKLIEVDKVSAVIGGNNTATGLAMASLAVSSKVPTVLTVPIVRDITGKDCDSHVFRIQAPTDVYARLLEPHLLPFGKKWYFIVGAYAYGLEAYKVMKARVEGASGSDAGMDATPVGTTDFSSYILKIRQAKPDLIVLAIAGNDLAAFLKQYYEFGMRIPVACHTVGDEDLWGQTWPKSHPPIVVAKFWHYNNPSNSPVENDFNSRYTKSKGHPASQAGAMAWTGMRLLLAGLEKAASTDALGIVRGLETARVDGVPGYFRDFDHQMIFPLVVAKVRDTVLDQYDVLEVLGKPMPPAELEAWHGSSQESACKMNAA